MTPPIVVEHRCSVCALPAPDDKDTCGRDSCRDIWDDYENAQTVYATAEQS